MRLKDKVAIVTGGGLGLGRAYSLALAREGARVVVADIAFEAAAAVARELDGLALQVDVTNAQETRAMAQRTVQAFGAIDILVNNAGLYAAIQKKPFGEIPLEEWDRVIEVNVMACSFARARSIRR
jgi:NAD(P)-dependent dehydrogenase (short-subunit alcohol dehydrogenase family)